MAQKCLKLAKWDREYSSPHSVCCLSLTEAFEVPRTVIVFQFITLTLTSRGSLKSQLDLNIFRPVKQTHADTGKTCKLPSLWPGFEPRRQRYTQRYHVAWRTKWTRKTLKLQITSLTTACEVQSNSTKLMCSSSFSLNYMMLIIIYSLGC